MSSLKTSFTCYLVLILGGYVTTLKGPDYTLINTSNMIVSANLNAVGRVCSSVLFSALQPGEERTQSMPRVCCAKSVDISWDTDGRTKHSIQQAIEGSKMIRCAGAPIELRYNDHAQQWSTQIL